MSGKAFVGTTMQDCAKAAKTAESVGGHGSTRNTMTSGTRKAKYADASQNDHKDQLKLT